MKYTKASLKNIQANAKSLGVEVKPSDRKNKKFDVYDKEGNYKLSIGDDRYKDYHLYKQEDKELAEERRRLYKKDMVLIRAKKAQLAIMRGMYYGTEKNNF